ncbi:hypothetical protein PIB30_090539 [Stylosanthes scabra]|uniref:Ubiquitin-like protease family profile domain-containing protein n=1 Tax=Stylosanthes scabra TaxID=79078 RepID=A0ABU6SV47_9FABA|nr:hypothetical protein [Stylosanthes scabra]
MRPRGRENETCTSLQYVRSYGTLCCPTCMIYLYHFEALDVSFPMALEPCHLDLCSSSYDPISVKSNDCGMYLAQWIIFYRFDGSYNVERITEYRRMRLVVDMMLKHHKDLCPYFIEDRLQYWRAYVKEPPGQE